VSGKTLSNTKNPFNVVVIVAALGYFVDIYDLILFSIVRKASLEGIGVPEAEAVDAGIWLINMQMIGMLLGGIVWGILGDKAGRLSALFLTILLYSLANIANGFVQTLDQYAWMRLIAGFGLAGELGVGITLVSEVMSKETRAWGTSIVSGVGIAGAVLAFAVSEWGWREAYFAGGGLGLLLLILRIYVHESGMFGKMKEQKVRRGDFFSFFTNGMRFAKYLACILAGVPVWFVIGILITFSSEFGATLGIVPAISSGKAIMYHYIGAAIGSLLTSFISQKLRSRKHALIITIGLLAVSSGWYFAASGTSATMFYFIIFLMGLAMGYWAIFVTVASEQFGTNIRSTATTTISNFVRGATVPMTLCWNAMAGTKTAPGMGILNSAIIVGIVVFVLAIGSVLYLQETYGKDLDYHEED